MMKTNYVLPTFVASKVGTTVHAYTSTYGVMAGVNDRNSCKNSSANNQLSNNCIVNYSPVDWPK